jgi:hypothetical protein
VPGRIRLVESAQSNPPSQCRPVDAALSSGRFISSPCENCRFGTFVTAGALPRSHSVQPAPDELEQSRARVVVGRVARAWKKASTAKRHYCDGNVVVEREPRTVQALVHVVFCS